MILYLSRNLIIKSLFELVYPIYIETKGKDIDIFIAQVKCVTKEID